MNDFIFDDSFKYMYPHEMKLVNIIPKKLYFVQSHFPFNIVEVFSKDLQTSKGLDLILHATGFPSRYEAEKFKLTYEYEDLELEYQIRQLEETHPEWII